MIRSRAVGRGGGVGDGDQGSCCRHSPDSARRTELPAAVVPVEERTRVRGRRNRGTTTTDVRPSFDDDRLSPSSSSLASRHRWSLFLLHTCACRAGEPQMAARSGSLYKSSSLSSSSSATGIGLWSLDCPSIHDALSAAAVEVAVAVARFRVTSRPSKRSRALRQARGCWE